jgi:hypothetical protein
MSLHFLAGCKLKRAKFSYDPNSAARQFTGVMEISIRLSIDRLRGGGPARVPISVLGMPCSGTTLTEQIIVSHPDVYGAGELHDLLRFAERNVTPSNVAWIPQTADTHRGQEPLRGNVALIRRCQ